MFYVFVYIVNNFFLSYLSLFPIPPIQSHHSLNSTIHFLPMASPHLPLTLPPGLSIASLKIAICNKIASAKRIKDQKQDPKFYINLDEYDWDQIYARIARGELPIASWGTMDPLDLWELIWDTSPVNPRNPDEGNDGDPIAREDNDPRDPDEGNAGYRIVREDSDPRDPDEGCSGKILEN